MGERNHIVLALSLGLAAGCMAGPDVPAVGETSAALGEPSGDYPNYDERVVLYATNRARVDPTKEGWSSYPAQPPLQWNEKLNESARAHSVDMRDTPCFQHNSCDNTDVFKRITSYYTTQYQSIGENISAGVPDGVTAVHNWLYEIGAAAGETGHRDNIFSKDFTLMGVGYAAGGSQYTNYWTQDFIGITVTRPALTDGIHFPKTAATGKTLSFGVTWYDGGGAAPTAVSVVVDGKCHALTLARGGDGMAAYEAALSFADGCHPYYFLAQSGSKTSLYPTSGSLQVGYGSSGASCTLFAASQAASDCGGGGTNPSPPPADMGHGSGQDGFMTRPPSAPPDMTTPKGNGGLPNGDGGIIGPGSTTGTTGGPMRSGGGCSLAGRSPVTAWPFLLVACAAWAFRRRRA